MNTWVIVLIVTAVILGAAAVALYFLGKRAQKKQAEQQEQIEAMKQTVSMLIIDKKRMKMKDAGLPQAVMASASKLMQRAQMASTMARSEQIVLVALYALNAHLPIKIFSASSQLSIHFFWNFVS